MQLYRRIHAPSYDNLFGKRMKRNGVKEGTDGSSSLISVFHIGI